MSWSAGFAVVLTPAGEQDSGDQANGEAEHEFLVQLLIGRSAGVWDHRRSRGGDGSVAGWERKPATAGSPNGSGSVAARAACTCRNGWLVR